MTEMLLAEEQLPVCYAVGIHFYTLWEWSGV